MLETVALKDHKKNFLNTPKNWLSKTSQKILGRTIKFISNRINTDLQNLIKLNQLKDTSGVTQWLKNIRHKQKH